MSKKRKKNNRRDHLHIGPPLAQKDVAEQSCVIDAAMDREWFARHPDRNERERPATELELRSTGHPPGTRVLVLRGPHGSQMRCFLEDT